MLAANLMTMLLLQRRMARGELELKRDVIFVTTSDEETGGKDGIQWLVTNHRDVLDAEFAINEGAERESSRAAGGISRSRPPRRFRIR